MILVDSSVWISYFRGDRTTLTDYLDELLATEEVAIGDLMLAEVLQGFPSERTARSAERLLRALTIVAISDPETAVEAASHYRALRRKGLTVRSTIDSLIATACIRRGDVLLHDDRDFDAFARHFGLKTLP